MQSSGPPSAPQNLPVPCCPGRGQGTQRPQNHLENLCRAHGKGWGTQTTLKPPQSCPVGSWRGLGCPNHPETIAAALSGPQPGAPPAPGCGHLVTPVPPPPCLSFPCTTLATAPSLIGLLIPKQRANRGTRVSLHRGFGLRGGIWGGTCSGDRDGEAELESRGAFGASPGWRDLSGWWCPHSGWQLGDALLPKMLWGGPDQGPNRSQQHWSLAPAQNHSPQPELPSLTYLSIPMCRDRWPPWLKVAAGHEDGSCWGGGCEHPLSARTEHTFGVVSYRLLSKTHVPCSLSITLSP